MEAIREVSASCRTIGEWVQTHEHMIQCVEKMQEDVRPLIKQGRDFSAPYAGVNSGCDSPFVGWLRDACDRVGAVRCVLPNTSEKHRLVGEIRMMHLDNQCLGPRFRDDTIVFGRDRTHYEALRIESLVKQIEEFVETL